MANNKDYYNVLDVERVRRIERKLQGDEWTSAHVARKKEECGEQNENNEEIACKRPDRKRRVRRERIHLSETFSSGHCL